MSAIDWLGAIVLFLHLPVPLYWFVLHPGARFWRERTRAAYIVAVLFSWLPVSLALVLFHATLFRRDTAPAWELALGIALILVEGWIFSRVGRDLGAARLVGAAELSGRGEVAEAGIYARIRHPRYVGSFLAIAGACMISGTKVLWIVAAVWVVLMRTAIALEERELRRRFGAAYNTYAERVPRFVPSLRASR